VDPYIAQTWSPEKGEERARQIDYILNNQNGKRSQWFYFDLDHQKLLYLTDCRNSKATTNSETKHLSTNSKIKHVIQEKMKNKKIKT